MAWFCRRFAAQEVRDGHPEAVFKAFEQIYIAAGAPRDVAMFQSPDTDAGRNQYFTPDTALYAGAFLLRIGAKAADRPTRDVQALMIGDAKALARFRQGEF